MGNEIRKLCRSEFINNTIFQEGGVCMKNNFDKCTVYYDDTNKSSALFAEQLSRHPDIEIKKASDYKAESMIVASNRMIGFVFPSENGELPYNIKHIMWKMIMKKSNHTFLVVSDGSRELRAVKSAIDVLGARGYIISHVYSKYIFEKLQEENPAQRVLEDLGNNESAFMEHQQAVKGFSKRELRKYIREDMKEYKKYKKRNKKAVH